MNELQHRCRSTHILGVRSIFARIYPNLPENVWAIFCALHEDRILDDLQKNVFMWLWVPFSQIKARRAPFLLAFLGSLPRFSGILRRFSQISPGFSPNQIFWGCACTPCTPASCTTELKYSYYWSKKSLSKKKRIVNYYGRHNMNESHWFQVSINVHKTPMECFEYTLAPRRRPPRYHGHFNAVFPIR